MNSAGKRNNFASSTLEKSMRIPLKKSEFIEKQKARSFESSSKNISVTRKRFPRQFEKSRKLNFNSMSSLDTFHCI